jgi:addiction module RelE/StbE family toxin
VSRRRRGHGVEWTDRALRDLEEIRAYIGRDDPVAADRWTSRLVDRVERAARVPLAGRVVPEFQRDDLREVSLRTYRIVYGVQTEAILVLTIFEGHRLLPEGRDPGA